MRRLLSQYFILTVFTIGLLGCGQKGGSSPEEVIMKNAEYMEKEDMSGVKSTIDHDSPNYDASLNTIQFLFDNYDLKYTIESIEIIEQSENEAKIKYVQLTTKVNGPAFKDNRYTGIHTLKKKDDGWKIYSTEQLNIEFLN